MLTQEQIARDLGLSLMTVYRCLSGKGSVSSKTSKRVMDYIQENNYQPNFIARSLVLKKSNIIGLLVPSFAYSFYPEIIESIQERLKSSGYKLLLCLSNESPETEREELEMLITVPVDGILMSPVNSKKSVDNCRFIQEKEIPFVLVDRYFTRAEKDCSYVSTDSFTGAKRIVEYLIGLGHKRIAHAGGSMDNSFSRAVFMGYKVALEENGLEFDQELVTVGALTEAGGYRGMKALLKRDVSFTALQAANDPIAIGVLNASYEAGIRIPDKLSLAGFSDISIARNLSVPLTTVKEPTVAIGRTAAEALIRQIEQPEKKDAHCVRELLAGKLVIRNSCCPPG